MADNPTHHDGRPLFLIDECLELWAPDPPRDGDQVYCRGFKLGRFGGTYGQQKVIDGIGYNEWYIELPAYHRYPPELADLAEKRARLCKPLKLDP